MRRNSTRKTVFRLIGCASTRALCALMVVMVAGVASAAEPRPWLCRDKPVVSSSQPVSYDLSCEGGGRWKIFFMQSDVGGGHDGFTVRASRDMPAHGAAHGILSSGQYFAVGLSLGRSGHWLCPSSVDEDNDSKASGAIADFTYVGSGPGTCRAVFRPSSSPITR